MKFKAFRSLALGGILCAFSRAQDFFPMETLVEPAIGDSAADYVLAPKPWWLRVATKEWQWVAIDPKIYYPPHIDPFSRYAIIEHEKVHLFQQRKMGKFKWFFKYAVNKKFRLDQELEPIVIELSNTPFERRKRLAERYALSLSGLPYHKAARSYDYALERILSKAAEMNIDIVILIKK
jgi:hypothetical protein